MAVFLIYKILFNRSHQGNLLSKMDGRSAYDKAQELLEEMLGGVLLLKNGILLRHLEHNHSLAFVPSHHSQGKTCVRSPKPILSLPERIGGEGEDR